MTATGRQQSLTDRGFAPSAKQQSSFVAGGDGDVVISHINQPTHAAGEGVARAILDLEAKGTDFVRLQDVVDSGDD
ncbi:hypothetical protein ASC90_17575 [Rhizobium sp. Root1220]|nr:hypothetical protein ASC90_17575 [Rhizobium sp. Root1220]